MTVLVFDDGPAEPERIETIQATPRRWYVEMKGARGKGYPRRDRSWWVMIGPPPEDDSVQITEYTAIDLDADPVHYRVTGGT